MEINTCQLKTCLSNFFVFWVFLRLLKVQTHSLLSCNILKSVSGLVHLKDASSSPVGSTFTIGADLCNSY